MTVLGKGDIQRSIGYGNLTAQRGEGRKLSIEPASMDVHLSSKTKHVESVPSPDNVVKVDQQETYPEYREVDVERPRVPAGEFVLATTQETIEVPNGMVALLHGRSSVGRLGLSIENAGVIDPGFSGQVTLELMNDEQYPIELVQGMRIGQLTFHDVKTAPKVGYSEHNGNKYEGQSGPTASRLYEDFQ